MEETCPCMMDGKGVDGCPCVSDMCGEDCMCMDGKSCMQDGMRAEGCMCENQCACENECACTEKKLEMLTAEMNAVFEKNMDLWNRFFGMMDKQPDMDMSYADYLTEQLEMVKEKFTEDEYKLLQQDIETIRRLDAEMARAHAERRHGGGLGHGGGERHGGSGRRHGHGKRRDSHGGRQHG